MAASAVAPALLKRAVAEAPARRTILPFSALLAAWQAQVARFPPFRKLLQHSTRNDSSCTNSLHRSRIRPAHPDLLRSKP